MRLKGHYTGIADHIVWSLSKVSEVTFPFVSKHLTPTTNIHWAKSSLINHNLKNFRTLKLCYKPLSIDRHPSIATELFRTVKSTRTGNRPILRRFSAAFSWVKTTLRLATKSSGYLPNFLVGLSKVIRQSVYLLKESVFASEQLDGDS